jgi:hypothetical protein
MTHFPVIKGSSPDPPELDELSVPEHERQVVATSNKARNDRRYIGFSPALTGSANTRSNPPTVR